jgi:hypothetical protein
MVDEAKMLKISWQKDLREMVEMPVPLGVWPVLAWALTPGEKVSKAIHQAALAYALQRGEDARFAFMHTIPAGAEEFVEVAGATLMQADWVSDGFVVLARGGTQQIGKDFRSWQRVGGA